MKKNMDIINYTTKAGSGVDLLQNLHWFHFSFLCIWICILCLQFPVSFYPSHIFQLLVKMCKCSNTKKKISSYPEGCCFISQSHHLPFQKYAVTLTSNEHQITTHRYLVPVTQHVFCVFQVKWSRENYYHNLSSPYCLRLASGDASGKIIVWDVVSGTAHCEIQEHSKPIQGNSPSRRLELIVFVPQLGTGLRLFFASSAKGNL